MRGMAKATNGFEMVRTIGLTFQGVEESTYFGQPALKTGGKMVACMASHRSAEPGSLVVPMDLARREDLLAEAPEVYYITNHYAGYPGVLVRLAKVRPEALRGLLAGAVQAAQRRGKRTRKSG